MGSSLLENLVDLDQLIDGRYKIDRLLGSGGMGWVLLAEDTTLQNNKVALKVLYPHHLQSSVSYTRFRREALTTMKLSHPRIVQTYRTGSFAGFSHYIAMEYVAGVSLQAQLESSRTTQFTAEQRIETLAQIASGLAYAHRSGVVHRDIKPENVLLTKELEAKIADFGLATAVGQESRITRVGDVPGTPLFMAPEQFLGESVDFRSDVYSFGITSFALLTGKAPFQSDSFVKLAEQHCESELPPLKSESHSYPAWIETILRQCVEKQKDDRYASMQEVWEAISAHTAETTTLEALELPAGSVTQNLETQRSSNFLRRTLLSVVLGLIVYTAVAFASEIRRNPELHLGAAREVMRVERSIGIELSPIRALVGITVKYGTESVFFDEKRSLRSMWPQLELGMDPNFYSKDKSQTPLHFWIETSSKNLEYEHVEKLLKHGANTELKDNKGRTALSLAVEVDNFAAIKLLLAAGANADVVNAQGTTPLHTAVLGGDLRVIQALMDAKANPNRGDRNGITPIDIANERQLSTILKILQE